MDSKQWKQSTTIWGAIVTMTMGIVGLTANILSNYGVTLTDSMQTNIVGIVLGIITIVSGGVSIHGRIKAKKVIKPKEEIKDEKAAN